MARYLLTGCAGFIGARVGELLLEAGDEVVGIDDMNDANDVRLKEWRLGRLLDHPTFSFHRIDIAERAALEELWRTYGRPPFAAVLNLAARAGVRPSVNDPWIYYRANLTGALNLLHLCRELDVPKFVLASTSSLYGSENAVPFREDANTDGPLSPYAASKKAAETVCYTYHHLFDIDVTVLRYFTVYGPAGRPDMSPFRFVQWISEGRPVTVYGDGRQSRDFTYVDDIARGTIAALEPLGYEIINLGSETPIVLLDAIRVMEEVVGKQAELEFHPAHAADMRATLADIGKARRLLDWGPQVEFRAGITELVSWYRENRDWAKDVRT